VFGLDGVVRLEGRRPRSEADRVAASADVLLVVDAPSDGPNVFLPSKLIDYLRFRKPILGVTGSRGASARLLKRLQCPTAAPQDVDEIATAVASLLEKWRAGALRVSPAFDAVAAEYDIRRTTAKLEDVLVRVAADAA
jgi:hypothetical protein